MLSYSYTFTTNTIPLVVSKLLFCRFITFTSGKPARMRNPGKRKLGDHKPRDISDQKAKFGPSQHRAQTFQDQTRQPAKTWAEPGPGGCAHTPGCARTHPEAVQAQVWHGSAFTPLEGGAEVGSRCNVPGRVM